MSSSEPNDKEPLEPIKKSDNIEIECLKKRKTSAIEPAEFTEPPADNEAKNRSLAANDSLDEQCYHFEKTYIIEANNLARSNNKKAAIELFSKALDEINQQKITYPDNHRLRERSIYCQLSILKCQIGAGWNSALLPKTMERFKELSTDIGLIYDEFKLIECYRRNQLICSRVYSTRNSIEVTEKGCKAGKSAHQYAACIFKALMNKEDMTDFTHTYSGNPSRKQWLTLALEQAIKARDFPRLFVIQKENLRLIQNIEVELQKVTQISENGFFNHTNHYQTNEIDSCTNLSNNL